MGRKQITQNNGDGSGWIVRVDVDGEIIWNNSYATPQGFDCPRCGYNGLISCEGGFAMVGQQLASINLLYIEPICQLVSMC